MSSFHTVTRSLLLSLAGVAAACSHGGERPSETPLSEVTPRASGQAERAAAAREQLDLGLLFARAGDSVRAEQYLAAALDSGADPNTALLPLLKLCIQASRLEAAAQYAEIYLKDVTAQRELEMLLGGLFITLDQSEKAILHLSRVTKQYPNHALAHFLLGRLLREQERDVELADQHFRAYLKLEPEGNDSGEARDSLLRRPSETEPLPDLSQADPPRDDSPQGWGHQDVP